MIFLKNRLLILGLFLVSCMTISDIQEQEVEKNSFHPLKLLENAQFRAYKVGKALTEKQELFLILNYEKYSIFDEGYDNKVSIIYYLDSSEAKKEISKLEAEQDLSFYSDGKGGCKYAFFDEVIFVYIWSGEEYFNVSGNYEQVGNNVDLVEHCALYE